MAITQGRIREASNCAFWGFIKARDHLSADFNRAAVQTCNPDYIEACQREYLEKGLPDLSPLRFFRAGRMLADHFTGAPPPVMPPLKILSPLTPDGGHFEDEVRRALAIAQSWPEGQLLNALELEMNIARRMADIDPEAETHKVGPSELSSEYFQGACNPYDPSVIILQEFRSRWAEGRYVLAEEACETTLHEIGHAIDMICSYFYLSELPLFVEAYDKDVSALNRMPKGDGRQITETIPLIDADNRRPFSGKREFGDNNTSYGRRQNLSYFLAKKDGGDHDPSTARSETFAELYSTIRTGQKSRMGPLSETFLHSATALRKILTALALELKRQPDIEACFGQDIYKRLTEPRGGPRGHSYH